jgi:hypothetical protein
LGFILLDLGEQALGSSKGLESQASLFVIHGGRVGVDRCFEYFRTGFFGAIAIGSKACGSKQKEGHEECESNSETSHHFTPSRISSAY